MLVTSGVGRVGGTFGWEIGRVRRGRVVSGCESRVGRWIGRAPAASAIAGVRGGVAAVNVGAVDIKRPDGGGELRGGIRCYTA